MRKRKTGRLKRKQLVYKEEEDLGRDENGAGIMLIPYLFSFFLLDMKTNTNSSDTEINTNYLEYE